MKRLIPWAGPIVCLSVLCLTAGCGQATRQHASSNLAGQTVPSTGWVKSRGSDKDEPGLALVMGRSMEKAGNRQAAIQAYQKAAKSEQHAPLAQHRLGVLHTKDRNYAEANRSFGEALKLQNRNAELYCDYGYCCLLQQRWQDAEVNLRQAIQLQPSLKRAHNNLGLLYAQTQRVPEARSHFLAGGCSEAEVNVNMAIGLAASGRREDALRSLQRGADDHPRAQQLLAQLTGEQPAQPAAVQEGSVVPSESAPQAGIARTPAVQRDRQKPAKPQPSRTHLTRTVPARRPEQTGPTQTGSASRAKVVERPDAEQTPRFRLVSDVAFLESSRKAGGAPRGPGPDKGRAGRNPPYELNWR